MQWQALGRVGQIHLLLFLLLNAFSAYCFLYVAYQMAYYPGDGFGNLPDDAPAVMKAIKYGSCNAIHGSFVVAVVWLPFALLSLKEAPTVRRRLLLGSMTLATILLYAFSFAILGMGYICW